MAVVIHGRSYIGSHVDFPELMSFRDITFSPRTNGDTAVAATSQAVEDAFILHHDRHNVVLNPFTGPEFFTRIRIKAKDLVFLIDYQFLFAARDIHNRRGGPGAYDLFCFPGDFTIILVQRIDGRTFNAGVHNHQVFIQYGRRSGTESGCAISDIRLPFQFSFQVVSDNTRCSKKGINARFITGWCTAGITMIDNPLSDFLNFIQRGD